MNNAGYRIEPDCVTESGWSELLSGFDDANIYQTWAYGSTQWGASNLSHLVLRRDGELVAAAQLRIFTPVHLKMGVAYLRWGPLCQPRGTDLDFAVVTAMADALKAEYVGRRALYLEVTPNAFAGSRRAVIYEQCFSRFRRGRGGIEPYRTFVLDLSPSVEQLRKNLDKKWRNQLSAAERNGLNIVHGTGMDEYRSFRQLYAQMRHRKSFYSGVNIEDFATMQESLPRDQAMHVFLCHRAEEPLAGLVCSVLGKSAIYLLGATNESGMKLKASYLLQWALIRFLKERAIRYYDLGGIDPDGNPGVHHFKKGLSGSDVVQMDSFTACDSVFSRAAVNTGYAVRSGLRHLKQRLALA
jgi:lipid II:glycine glycyltransferase (peptidoglycan interpeptide bridge formation enzyme)